MSKCDPTLGYEVHQHLVKVGVETPMTTVSPYRAYNSNYGRDVFDKQEQRAAIERHVRGIMQALCLDLGDDSLAETPKRVAKMYVDEIFYGLDYDLFPKATVVENKFHVDEMVVEKDINVQSSCEHHLITISGKACVAYIPKDKVLGLSKINRIVEFFCKRPAIQERLTLQIYHALSYILGTDDVAVLVNAEHFCVKSRGIKDVGSSTVTSKLGGIFLDGPVRAEFLSLAKG